MPIKVVMYPTPNAGPPTVSSAERRLQTDDAAQILDGRNGFERPVDDLARPGALSVVGQPGLQQLRVGENHTQLVVQPMEHLRKIWRGIRRRLWRARCGVRRHG
jgi:hypothetical protein